MKGFSQMISNYENATFPSKKLFNFTKHTIWWGERVVSYYFILLFYYQSNFFPIWTAGVFWVTDTWKIVLSKKIDIICSHQSIQISYIYSFRYSDLVDRLGLYILLHLTVWITLQNKPTGICNVFCKPVKTLSRI